MMSTELDINEMEEAQFQEWNGSKNAPKILFKYKAVRTIDDLIHLVEILKDHKIYFPTVQELNDSFEGTGTNLISEGKDVYASELRNNYRVLCLSGNCFSPTMWAHYGGNRSGVCIGFLSGSPLSPANQSVFKDATPIDYVDSLPDKFSADTKEAIEKDLTRKLKTWSYENEWRIIASDRNAQQHDADSKKHFFEFDKKDIACIILGEKMKDALKEIIANSVPEIPIYTIICDFKKSAYSAQNKLTGVLVDSIDALLTDLKA